MHMDDDIGPKTQKRVLHALPIHPAREPGVINNAMIVRCILEYGPPEEAGRLFAEEGVHMDEACVVRLEFQRIIRLDHLWMLTSLTKLTLAHNLIEKIENLHQLTKLIELDLSFNKIEKIENLELLVNLEVLTLFHNKIKKMENMDALENLLVFSIGDNLIEDFKELSYLRRFRCLRSVSFKGNPCCDDPMAYTFLAAALPRVTYLDYIILTEQHRENGYAIFRGIIRQLDDADEKLEIQRLAKEEYDQRVVFLSKSFVEYLSGPELIVSMFSKENDPDGYLLLGFGGEILPVLEQYKEEYVATMADLIEFALEAFNDREKEIKLFKDLVNNALADSVEKSKNAITEFEGKKKPLVLQLSEQVAKFVSKQSKIEEIEVHLIDLGDQFNTLVYELWRTLMTLEMQLFEQCEESRVQFSVNITEMINKLLDVARNAFGIWRDSDGTFSSSQLSILMKYLGNKVMLGDACPELYEAMMDRDLLMDYVAQSMDSHSRFIDAREDRLLTRAQSWIADIVNGTNDNEIKRNRDRITEINYFIDNQRTEWADLQMALSDPTDNEAAAAAFFGDEF